MIDQEKLDWKEPLLAKFKSYAIGFGAALLLVGAIVAAIAYFTPPLAPQTEPTITAYPLPQTQSKVVKPAIKKEAAKAVNKPSNNVPEATFGNKPKPAEPLTQFDRDLANFESKL